MALGIGLGAVLVWHGLNAEAAESGTPPAVASAPTGAPSAAVALDRRFGENVRPLLARYCYNCHGNGKHKGDLSLDSYVSLTTVQSDRATWLHLSDVLQQKTMPPEGKPQPTQVELDLMTGWVGEALNYCDCTGPRDPGRVAIHRLNRNEYNNTVRDLLGVTFRPADDFPADDTGYGFDNIADVLSMSPLLAEKYVRAAEDILEKVAPAVIARKPQIASFEDDKIQCNGPANKDGRLVCNGEAFVQHSFPAAGKYEIRFLAGQDKFGDEAAKMVLRLDGKDIKTVSVVASTEKPDTYKLSVDVKAGKHRVAAAFTNDFSDQTNADPAKRGDRNLLVSRIQIEGPSNAAPPPPTDAYKRIFFVSPSEAVPETDAARQILARFAARAYRRPVAADEVDALLKLYQGARGDGDSFAQGVKLALTGALVSPNFLYRIEVDPAAGSAALDTRGVYTLSDYELASRLSYFLWSSMPDEALTAAAESGHLHEASVLDAQVKRMLADARSSEFISNFAGQWLELRNLEENKPDATAYPQFDESLRTAMRRETDLFLENLIREDRSVLELLSCDYTFLNERLAKHYGITGITGNKFRKVNLADAGPAGKRRGGVLMMGSVLTVTAMPTRTSPVKRGKFVLEEILGTPPPPPPPGVPALSEKPKDTAKASLKKRLESHRADPNCAVCHLRMDAIGFSLENFDAIGGWRVKDGEFNIDSAGKLPDGSTLSGPEGLREMLLGQQQQFLKCLAEKMLTYALGRGLEYYDTCTVKDIVADAQKNDYRFSSVIGAIVRSDAFQKRRLTASTPTTRPAMVRKPKA